MIRGAIKPATRHGNIDSAFQKDMDRARHFYEGNLGLKPVGQRLDGKFTYDCAGATLALFPKEGGTKADHTAISFQVPNIATSIAELEKQGVKFEDYDFPGLKTVEHVCVLGAERAAWFLDTEGNILCLHEDLLELNAHRRLRRGADVAVEIYASSLRLPRPVDSHKSASSPLIQQVAPERSHRRRPASCSPLEKHHHRVRVVWLIVDHDDVWVDALNKFRPHGASSARRLGPFAVSHFEGCWWIDRWRAGPNLRK